LLLLLFIYIVININFKSNLINSNIYISKLKGTGVTYNVNIEQEVTCADCDGYGKRKIFHEKCKILKKNFFLLYFFFKFNI